MKPNKQICILVSFIFIIFTHQSFSMGMRRPKPKPTPTPIATATPKPTPVPTTIPLSIGPTPYADQIRELANVSSCAQYNWNNRGQAPIGYIKGMAISFAHSYCRLKKNNSVPDSVVQIMSAPNTYADANDALAHYQDIFSSMSFTNDVAGVGPLLSLYSLGIGLGMRESSGSYCEGWDTSAGSNRSSDTGEAGLFQTSYDSITASSALTTLYSDYKLNTSKCLLNTFKEGVSCGSSSILGTGAGADFQVFTKACPAFATEYAMTMLRVRRSHYGPINRKEAEVTSACYQLLVNVKDFINQDIQNTCLEIY